MFPLVMHVMCTMVSNDDVLCSLPHTSKHDIRCKDDRGDSDKVSFTIDANGCYQPRWESTNKLGGRNQLMTPTMLHKSRLRHQPPAAAREDPHRLSCGTITARNTEIKAMVTPTPYQSIPSPPTRRSSNELTTANF